MLDALCQGIESFWSVKSTPESKAYARAAIEEVLRYVVDYLALDGHDSALVVASSIGSDASGGDVRRTSRLIAGSVIVFPCLPEIPCRSSLTPMP